MENNICVAFNSEHYRCSNQAASDHPPGSPHLRLCDDHLRQHMDYVAGGAGVHTAGRCLHAERFILGPHYTWCGRPAHTNSVYCLNHIWEPSSSGPPTRWCSHRMNHRDENDAAFREWKAIARTAPNGPGFTEADKIELAAYAADIALAARAAGAIPQNLLISDVRGLPGIAQVVASSGPRDAKEAIATAVAAAEAAGPDGATAAVAAVAKAIHAGGIEAARAGKANANDAELLAFRVAKLGDCIKSIQTTEFKH
jgi:hypothetical protein